MTGCGRWRCGSVRSRRRRRRPAGGDDLRVPAGGRLPRRIRRDDMAAPDRRQRLSGPDTAKAATRPARSADEGMLDVLASQGGVPATPTRQRRDTTLEVRLRCGTSRPSSGSRSSWSTCSGTRWPTPRPCWTSRSGPSRAVAPEAGPGCCPTSSTFAAAQPRIPPQKTGFHGTVPLPAASHLGREEMDEAAISARRR